MAQALDVDSTDRHLPDVIYQEVIMAMVTSFATFVRHNDKVMILGFEVNEGKREFVMHDRSSWKTELDR